MALQTSAQVVGRLRRAGSGGWLRVAVTGCAALAVALALLAHALTPSPDQTRRLIGHAAPTFTAPVAQSGHLLAHPARVAGANGNPTLLVFFNTLCVHCLSGVQIAQSVAQTSSAGAVNVVYLDAPGENAQITGNYMARLRANPPVLLDHGAKIASAYGVTYYPSFVLVDARGVIRATWTGSPSVDAIRSAIAAAQQAGA